MNNIYQIDANEFFLELNPKDIDDDHIALTVRSFDFSATKEFIIYKKSFLSFIKEICDMYQDLSGTALLIEDFDTGSYISFSCDQTGHVDIDGKIVSERGTDVQTMKLCNSIDQTYLKGFIEDLCRDFYQEAAL